MRSTVIKFQLDHAARVIAPPLPRPRPALTHGDTPPTYSPAPRPVQSLDSVLFSACAVVCFSPAELSSFLSLHDVESAALQSQDGGVWSGGAAMPPAGAGGRCELMRD